MFNTSFRLCTICTFFRFFPQSTCSLTLLRVNTVPVSSEGIVDSIIGRLTSKVTWESWGISGRGTGWGHSISSLHHSMIKIIIIRIISGILHTCHFDGFGSELIARLQFQAKGLNSRIRIRIRVITWDPDPAKQFGSGSGKKIGSGSGKIIRMCNSASNEPSTVQLMLIFNS